ncbi:barstar family protein [Actinomadura graeca]|uniref:Barstar family protein n=1 Tax=Actinomadura graeca TaxID=2750812 RepID=A0ABX8QWE3_9ACTN|nr:barstar family protein [Actinomadura graeca]QXJ23042.1 barstar family protein [Actinomadura graeca]
MDAEQALDDLLAGRVNPGVYQWTTRPAPDADSGTSWRERAERAGWRGFHLDGHHVRDKEAFLRLCAEVFDFPEWFGGNWDALADCLADLSWTSARHSRVVLYESWPELAEAEPESFRTVLDVFADAVEVWRDTPTPMTVILSSVGVEAEGVPRIA